MRRRLPPLTLILLLSSSACGSGQEDNPIVGTWVVVIPPNGDISNGREIYTFNSDGTASRRTELQLRPDSSVLRGCRDSTIAINIRWEVQTTGAMSTLVVGSDTPQVTETRSGCMDPRNNFTGLTGLGVLLHNAFVSRLTFNYRFEGGELVLVDPPDPSCRTCVHLATHYQRCESC